MLVMRYLAFFVSMMAIVMNIATPQRAMGRA
jgi:hypothetical protein